MYTCIPSFVLWRPLTDGTALFESLAGATNGADPLGCQSFVRLGHGRRLVGPGDLVGLLLSLLTNLCV